MIDKRKLEKTYASLDEDTDFVEEDAIILALPNNEATKWADKISKQNSQAIILDLSADHRFDGEWHYSVPELTQTIGGNKISNPGCYATAMQLMLAPIKNMIDGEVNFFGISGYSGAGATPNDRNDPNKLKNNIKKIAPVAKNVTKGALAKVPYLLPIIAAYDVVSGIAGAEEILEAAPDEEVSFFDRLGAGIGKLVETTTFGLVDAKTTANFLGARPEKVADAVVEGNITKLPDVKAIDTNIVNLKQTN